MSPTPFTAASFTSAGDRLLARAVEAAAARAALPGRVRFTERQLYYETCRLLSPSTRLPVRPARSAPPALRLTRFAGVLAARTGPVPGLLAPVAPDAFRPPAGSGRHESDLYAYGVPRLLLCQDRDIAAMLLANQIHLEAACPVFPVADAPAPDGPLVAALVRARGATVHVLHDASPAGIALPQRVRAALGPLPGVRVASMGLVPRHAAALRLPSGRGPSYASGVRDAMGPLPAGLRPDEAAWLDRGRFAEVAAVPPARLLRAVLRMTRGLSRPARGSVREDLRELRAAGFLSWPAP
ncbi:hypothetical protein [uncultured Streptomyces sp.]|uniref:hypothetical protein n=1 Tax=uncultured Streptomyces sp. TaxID=174707 RepID=UPI00260A991B|nr:hypothetical protein [uncultured Streptomyces sp.]